jgi:hypothetical protein
MDDESTKYHATPCTWIMIGLSVLCILLALGSIIGLKRLCLQNLQAHTYDEEQRQQGHVLQPIVPTSSPATMPLS